MSGLPGHERDASPDTFPDWLAQIQREYLNLTELYEKEREYGQRLAELMANVQHEVGFPIPLNPIVLSAALPDVTEAQLGEGAVIFYVDSAGNRGTRPLTLMPLETIIFTVHECTFRLKEMISEKRRLMARRVRALERVNLELDKAQETLKYSQPDSEPELEKVGEASSEFASVNLEFGKAQEVLKYAQPVSAPEHSQPIPEPEHPQSVSAPELRKAVEAPKELADLRARAKELADLTGSPEKISEPAEAPIESFQFKGSFKDKREAVDEKVWGSE